MSTLANLSDSALRKIIIALALYLTSLLAANTLGLKIMPMPLGLHLSVSIFFFPFVFLTTDVIGQAYGKPLAKLFVLAGIISTAAFIVYSLISLVMPWAQGGMWAHDGYNQMFGVSVRIAVASLIAFAIGEYQDVIMFFFTRRFLGSGLRFFWLNSFLSNAWSQLLDSVIFGIIAFAGVYSTPTLISMTRSWWLFKVGMGFLYTPLLYAGVWLLRDEPAHVA